MILREIIPLVSENLAKLEKNETLFILKHVVCTVNTYDKSNEERQCV